MAFPVVELRDVTKRFGSGPPVLEPISLAAGRDDFVALIGPSGCGKSTLLRLIAGLIAPTTGTVRVDDPAADAGSSGLGFVFQDPTLLPWATVAANIELPLKLRGVTAPERRQRRARVLEQMRLTEKANAYPRALSGGQKMRVSLARTLALNPRLLLLDEPFAALDEMTREHLNEELLALRAASAWTAFFVTHSVNEAVFLANRVIVLAAQPGRIHADIAVPLPYPRTADTRLSEPFQRLVRDVGQALRAINLVPA